MSPSFISVRCMRSCRSFSCGWSYGGNVATAVALDDPDRVRSLISEPALSSMVKEGAAGDAARDSVRARCSGQSPRRIEAGDAEKATRLLIEGVFQMPPGGFAAQPPEVQAIQLENARTIAAPVVDRSGGSDLRHVWPTVDNADADRLRRGDATAYWPHIAREHGRVPAHEAERGRAADGQPRSGRCGTQPAWRRSSSEFAGDALIAFEP